MNSGSLKERLPSNLIPYFDSEVFVVTASFLEVCGMEALLLTFGVFAVSFS